MNRVNNNQTLYTKLLKTFYKEYMDMPDQIRQALNQKNHPLALRLAHTLKGVAGSIGALDLQKKCRRVEQAIKEGCCESDNLLIIDFEKALKIVIQGLKAAGINEDENKSTVSTDQAISSTEKLLEMIVKLQAPLKKGKPKPSKELMVTMNTFNWPARYASQLETLTQLVEKYKFKDALHLIETLIPEIKA